MSPFFLFVHLFYMKVNLILVGVVGAISVLVDDKEVLLDQVSDMVPETIKSPFRRIASHVQQDHLRVPLSQGQTLGESILRGNQPKDLNLLRDVLNAAPPRAFQNIKPKSARNPSLSSASGIPLASSPSVILESKTSWVKEYLAFRAKNTVTSQAIPVLPRNDLMKSAISNYQNLQADPSDLRAWTHFLVESSRTAQNPTNDSPNDNPSNFDNPSSISNLNNPSNPSSISNLNNPTNPSSISNLNNPSSISDNPSKSNLDIHVSPNPSSHASSKFDYSYRKFGTSSQYTDTTSHTKIDVEDFICYLIEVHGFSPADVSFLRTADLDHGLEEIEKELNRAKDKNDLPRTTIDIGGELPNSSHTPNANYVLVLIAVVFLLFVG